MKIRQLGADGPAVSQIGLGCLRMTLPPAGGGRVDEVEGIATIHAALDAGVSFLNTGDFYSAGANEILVGKAIKDRRDQAIVSVKFGALRSASGPFLGFDCRPNAVKNFCAYSLQRLGVEVIDLYQPCRVDPGVPLEDTIGAVADLIKEGKVRYLGVSEYNAAQLRRAHAVHPVAALEIEYSLASRFIEAEILPAARELGVGVAAYSVITKGLLTGEMPSQLAPGDERAVFPRFQGENLKKNIAAVDGLIRLAEVKGATPAQLAIAWVMAQGPDIVPIVGMSSRKRVPENLKAADIELSRDDLARLDALFRPGVIAGGRYPAALEAVAAS